ALHRLSASTASLHVAPGRFTTILNPRQIFVFAPWQDVRFGSRADVVVSRIDVRFTPHSGHVRCTSRCLLRAKSRHWGGSEKRVGSAFLSELRAATRAFAHATTTRKLVARERSLHESQHWQQMRS